MKRGGCARSDCASAVTTLSLAANWRSTTSADSCASRYIRVSLACMTGVFKAALGAVISKGTFSRANRQSIWSISLQFGDKVVDVAAIPGAGELDHAAVVQKTASLDAQARATRSNMQQTCLLRVQ